MALNESKGNMYSWITHTWNTVKGECPHGCIYCYMSRWGKQKTVRFDESELKTDLGTGKFIFVGSSCDLFADGIPDSWIYKTLNHCNKFDNSYLFQSKNPGNMLQWIEAGMIPFKSIFCTTIETNRWIPDVMVNSPTPHQRSMDMNEIGHKGFETFVTIEPIIDFDLEQMVYLIETCLPKQVNIGADSGNNHLPEPSKEKLMQLIKALKEFTIIDQKRNLARLLK